VPGELLDSLRCSAPHRQMRTEGVPKDVRSFGDPHARLTLRGAEPTFQVAMSKRLAVVATEDRCAPNEEYLPERLGQRESHRDDAAAPALRRVDNVSPHRTLDDELTASLFFMAAPFAPWGSKSWQT
jgi:hypothetical protein